MKIKTTYLLEEGVLLNDLHVRLRLSQLTDLLQEVVTRLPTSLGAAHMPQRPNTSINARS